MRSVRAAVALAGLAALAAGSASARPAARVMVVGSDGAFAGAVAALGSSGGTIVLTGAAYGDLAIGPRGSAPLRIAGLRSGRTTVERLSLTATQHVTVERVAVAPRTGDAWIRVTGARHVELADVLVSAAGTEFAASVEIRASHGVTLSDSELTHCGDRSPHFVDCVLLDDGATSVTLARNRFHDCLGCDFVHGRFRSGLTLRGNRFDRALPCRIGRVRCGHQDLVELFAGRRLRVEGNRFGVYRLGGAQLYITNDMDGATIVNNVFVGTDPRVPGYRSRVGLVVGSAYSRRLPYGVRVVNNTILTGARRSDGYEGSVRISSLYGGVPRWKRPLFANNVIGVLRGVWPVCSAARASVTNVVVSGIGCSRTDRVGPVYLDGRGRPTLGSWLLVDSGTRRHAPPRDFTGRRRDDLPDIGAYELRP
jgi:hypothetical protein